MGRRDKEEPEEFHGEGTAFRTQRKQRKKHSVLLEPECNVLEKLRMIKIQVIKVSFQWEKKVKGLEIFRHKITDDAFSIWISKSAKN